MWQGSWIHLWTVTSSLCSMSRLAGWYMLRNITKHATLFYLCICQKRYSEKLEKHLQRGLFCKSCGITYHSLLEIEQSCFARNLTKVLFAVFKDKKALTTVMKENLRLKQLRLNYINNNNNNNNNKRAPNISKKLFQGRCGFKYIRTIDSRLASVFLKNPKHFLEPISVLLF